MPKADLVDETINTLSAARANTSCSDLARLLGRLGFTVRDGRKAGHKVYTHSGLVGFFSSSYTCGHGKNPSVKPVYIGNVIKVLRQHEQELQEYLRRQT